MVIKWKGRRERVREGGRGKHTWIWIYNGSQQADRVLSSTKMSRVWKWNQESYRTSTSTSSTTHAMATADKFIKCFSQKRDRERGESGREREKPESTRNTRRGTDLTVPKDMPMKFNTFSSFFFLRGMLHCMRCLSPSLSLFLFLYSFLALVLFR